MNDLRDALDESSYHDFGHTITPWLIAAGGDVGAYRFADGPLCGAARETYWRDVGTIDAYWEANMDLVHVNPALDLYDKAWPIWTRQEQLQPAKLVFDVLAAEAARP